MERLEFHKPTFQKVVGMVSDYLKELDEKNPQYVGVLSILTFLEMVEKASKPTNPYVAFRRQPDGSVKEI